MPKRELKPGEMICPECKGEGQLDAGVFIFSVCKKCDGTGIVDWVSVAMQKPDKFLCEHDDGLLTSSYAVKSYIANTSIDFSEEMKDSIAKIVREQIDKEILSEVVRLSMQAEEQNLKRWMVSKGENIDNGIIS